MAFAYAHAQEQIYNRYHVNFTPGETKRIECPSCKVQATLNDPRVGLEIFCHCGMILELVYYRPVHDPKELQEYLDAAKVAPSLSYDYETTGFSPFQHRMVGCSFSREDEPGVAIYVPMFHAIGACMREEVAREIIAPVLASYRMNAHNFCFEWKWTKQKWGVEPRIHSDSMVESWLDDLNRKSRFDPRSIGLKEMAGELWQLHVVDLKSLIDIKKGQNFSFLPVSFAYEYGCQDSDLTTRLVRRYRQANIRKQPKAHRREHKLIPITARMELAGQRLDPEALAQGLPILAMEIERKHREVFIEAGYDLPEEDWVAPCKLSNSLDAAKLLFVDCNIPYDTDFVGKASELFPNGTPSTSKKALELIRDDHAVVDLLLQYREDKYAMNNYIEKLPDKVDPVTGAIHTGFMQQGTPTIRYTSNNPNLQAIAKKRD